MFAKTTLLLGVILSACSAQAEHQKLDRTTALRLMSPGINFGNTLEAIPKETSWGNPEPNAAAFRAIRAAGFRSVRIPIAWTQYADTDNNIGAAWMKHVTDVVRMAEGADLFVVINIHWDGGWLQPTPQKREAATKKLCKFWKQIAANFGEFDQRLLFAGTNETGIEGQYGIPAPDNAEIQNSFNQAFVNTVRSTGGRNRDRFLVVQAYSTDIDSAMKFNTVMPTDTVKGRLMMEVHFYSPYNFTLNEKSDVWQWGANATDPKATDTWGNEAYVDGQFLKVKQAFVDKGVPVILGEYAVGLKPKFPGMRRYQKDWVAYVTRSAYRNGMVPMYWDIGAESGLFNRATGARQDSELIGSIVGAVKG
ncbi:glycoside hydrolase family 5 protein [Fimbriimonas ginsengisoli]|uniref:Endoglucanase A n=1 Tax=Fimbriimonas ginsengisoli Gsoil 348 TaxID=661478 RepID=A0A068NJP9_FIMGI|nr:glycoside hydrolase family 5 protein [Fimbriimonas ginsengisoli]AIE83677.1 endoglucanase A [Fimbriimonas ginsengisoli Gsoil 348]